MTKESVKRQGRGDLDSEGQRRFKFQRISPKTARILARDGRALEDRRHDGPTLRPDRVTTSYSLSAAIALSEEASDVATAFLPKTKSLHTVQPGSNRCWCWSDAPSDDSGHRLLP